MNDPTLIIVAIIGFTAPTMATVVSAFLANRYAQRAQENATKAQLATERAKTDSARAQEAASQAAAKAQEAASQAAAALVATAQTTDQKLSEIAQVARGTHTLVNSQRTVLLVVVANLARRIANENPDDAAALRAAVAAEEEAAKAQTTQADGIGGAT